MRRASNLTRPLARKSQQDNIFFKLLIFKWHVNIVRVEKNSNARFFLGDLVGCKFIKNREKRYH